MHMVHLLQSFFKGQYLFISCNEASAVNMTMRGTRIVHVYQDYWWPMVVYGIFNLHVINVNRSYSVNLWVVIENIQYFVFCMHFTLVKNATIA